MNPPLRNHGSAAASRALEDALRAAAFDTTVEVTGGLAILRVDTCNVEQLAGRRVEVVELAMAHGFTHVAIEI
ncbi:MAG: hypothetical protein ACT4OZ_08360 [Gemmatimonadota bacterium]